MHTEKAAYWLALAAFGFALHGVCPRGTLQNLNHALGHTGSTLCRFAADAERAVMASALINHPRLQPHDSWSTTDASEMVHGLQELDQRHLDETVVAQDQVEQARDQALAQADAMREEALAKADLMRQQALAQAAIARAELEMKRAEIGQMRIRIQPQVRLSRAVNRHLLVMSSDPCDYGRASDAVSASIELSDDEQ